ncbi:hypothetical protein MIR68_000693 [Amoeboaphelidium protococcarum]|nr:hypothetical protein MIR68_000693 [Amoeboaphelidium protococcarum]
MSMNRHVTSSSCSDLSGHFESSLNLETGSRRSSDLSGGAQLQLNNSDKQSVIARVQEWIQVHQAEYPLDDSGKGDPQACIFVASLNSGKTLEQLHQSVLTHFQQYGPIVSVKVSIDNQNRPFAFVQFKSVQDANKARIKSQHSVIDSRAVRIEKAKVNRTLFVAKFSKQWSRGDIMEILEQFGPIEDFHLLINNHTHQSKGSGFVKFIYREDALKAFACLKGQFKSWVVEWASDQFSVRNRQEVDYYSIFVGNLNLDLVNEDALIEKFTEFGDIESMKLIDPEMVSNKEAEDTGNNRRSAFCFITYSEMSSAARAISMNEQMLMGCQLRVQYKGVPSSSRSRNTTAPVSYPQYRRMQLQQQLQQQQYAQQFFVPMFTPLSMYPYQPMYGLAPPPTVEQYQIVGQQLPSPITGADSMVSQVSNTQEVSDIQVETSSQSSL